jgi:hypothetical protein
VSGSLNQPMLPGHPAREHAASSRRRPRGAWTAWIGAALLAVIVVGVVLLLPRFLLDWDIAGGKPPADRAQAVNAVRATLLQGLAGLAVLIGAFFAWRQLQVNRQGQITDRFTAAVGQLGQPSSEVRIGAIFALERIAWDSKPDRLAIVEVLTAFVRLHAPLSPSTDGRPRPTDLQAKRDAAENAEGDEPLRVRAAHVQVAATVLGRLPSFNENRPDGLLSRVDLRRGDLGHSDLAGADLHYSDLSGAFLGEADLTRADLTGVWFARAVLINARLYQADLRSAVFWQARLEGADLGATDLTAADFTSARLDAVKLDLADLRGADFTDTDLAGVSLQGSVADDTTIWPLGFDPLPAGVRIGLAAPPLRPQNWIQ